MSTSLPLGKAPCQWLAWDSDFFGLNIARVTVNRLDAELSAAVAAWCHAQKIECVYFLADPEDDETRRQVEAAGFRLVDTRLTLQTELQASVPSRPNLTNATIGPVVAAEVAQLRAIAGVSHRDSRFYADGGFDRRQCDRLYETWIETCCRDNPAGVLVVRRAGSVAGYVACQLAIGAGQISLVAVAPEAQGQGIGKALVAAGLGWCWEHNARQVSVVTQARNVRATRLYEGLGFRIQRRQLWFHRWFTSQPEAQSS